MRYLLTSITLLLVGCASYPKKQGLTVSSETNRALTVPYFSNIETDYIYKASIDVFNKHFSGLFIVKKTGENIHRVAFTTEMGTKIFDFSFSESQFTVNFIQEELNRKPLLKILEQDFRTLICEKPDIAKSFSYDGRSVLKGNINNQAYFFYLDSANNLIETVYPKRGKASIVYSFSKINSDIAEEIKIKHQSLQMTINLKSFKKS